MRLLQLPRLESRGVALALAVVLVAIGFAAVGCATANPTSVATARGVLRVVAAENFWGSLAGQLGGSHVHTASIIDRPGADPHDYEPTAHDAVAMAEAQVIVLNGIGYDGWASKLVAANPVSGRVVITVGDVVGIRPGGNPHRWYSPSDVRAVLDAVTSAYKRLLPADAADFDRQHEAVVTQRLGGYFGDVAAIKARYAGTAVGASESVFTPLAQALGLRLVTPQSLLDAVSEGVDPTAAAKRLVDEQIRERRIKVYVYNSQNATPDVQAQVGAARRAGIPVTTITETMTPAGTSFQAWQVRQLDALRQALAQGTGR